MSKWLETALLDVARLSRGTEPGSASYMDSSRGVRFLRVGDVTGKTDNPVFTNSDQVILVDERDILLTLDGSPGYVSTGHKGAISSGIRRIEPIDVRKVCRSWLKYSLMFPSVQETIKRHTTGVTILHASTAVPYIRIPLPPLIEQERLARILDEADAMRHLAGEADKRTNQLADATFDEMFRNRTFGATSWSKVALRELGAVVTGNTPPRGDSSFYGDFIEWVKTDNIDPNRGIVRPSAERLSETGSLRGRVVPEGSVPITCIAGSIERIGDAAVTDRKVAINQQINAIVPNENVESGFLGALIRALKPQIHQRATGVMTRIINKSELEKIPAILPPSQLQQRFTSYLTEIRKLEQHQAARRQRLED